MSQVDLRDWFKSISSKMARRVLDDAKESGMPDEEVAAMRKRMTDWYRILTVYKKEIAEVRADLKMSGEFKQDLVDKMRENLYNLRKDIFGE
jgi:tryptophanyl-tRNA synthetase